MTTLNQAIQRTIESAQSENDAASVYFHWNNEDKTWCLSGETVGHLGWETDDVEADSREQAESEAVDYLLADLDDND